MIRIGLPIPIYWRLRPTSAAPSPTVSAESTRHWHDRIPWLARRRALAHATTIMNLRQFEERYQGLIDVLCGAAKEGVGPRHLERYNELRAWFLTHYDSVRPTLAGYVAHDEEDAVQVLGAPWSPRDVFESLFLPPTLESVVNSDTVISRLQRTRRALESCLDDAESSRT